jgi:hypothetical protein
MSLRNGFIVELNSDIANSFVAKYEHLGDVGLGVWHWGLLIDGILASVLSFGMPCFAVGRSFLNEVSHKCGARVLQLCRGATPPWAPMSTPSRTICLALRAISKKVGPALVVAYADPHFHEIGTIYQASNAIYTGETNPKGQADYIINGEILSGWVVRKRYGTRCRVKLRQIDGNMRVLPLGKKFRYVLLAGSWKFRREARRLLDPYKAPYPRRTELGIPAMNIREMMKSVPVGTRNN